MKKEKMDLKREITKTKKREKIVIHNVDGTTEEYKTGILFTLEEINFKGDGEVKFIITPILLLCTLYFYLFYN